MRTVLMSLIVGIPTGVVGVGLGMLYERYIGKYGREDENL